MKIKNILEAEQEAKRFLKKLNDVRKSETNQEKFKMISKSESTWGSKETGSLKRSSMDLTRSLSKMRNEIY